MTQKPLLSIMIPFYAKEGNERNILLNQLLATIPDEKDVEIIIVDDRSPVPLRLTHTFKNATCVSSMTPYDSDYAGAARNHAMRIARGCFLTHADSDDLFDTQAMSHFLRTLERDKHRKEVHLLGAYSFTESPDALSTKPVYNRVRENKMGFDITRLLPMWHAPWGKVFSEDLLPFVQGSFKENDVVDDCLFSTELAIHCETLNVVPGQHYFWRRETGHQSITSTLTNKVIAARIQAQRDANNRMLRANRPDAVASMLYIYKEYAFTHPTVVLKEFFRSLVLKDKILPKRSAVLNRLKERAYKKRPSK